MIELDEVLFPRIKRCREVDEALRAAQAMMAAGGDGAAERLKAAKEELTYAHACRMSAFAFCLGV